MITVGRSFQSPFESRYMYIACVLVTLMVVELARGVIVPHWAQLALLVLTLVAVGSNIGVLRQAGGTTRQDEARTSATLGVVELDRGSVASDTMLAQLPEYPL